MREYKDPGIHFFGSDPSFARFRCALDGIMKKLQSEGVGVNRRQAESILPEEEELLWEKGLLGNGSPQALLDTMVYMAGLYFSLHSGQEHRNLRLSQIRVVDRCPESMPYLEYTENISKNHPGELKHRKLSPQKLCHYGNCERPERWFVHLFKLYCSHHPPNVKDDAFYFTSLKNPHTAIWYSVTLVGHHTLTNTVKRMCEAGGIGGFKTNHSLRVTTATCLFQHGVHTVNYG